MLMYVNVCHMCTYIHTCMHTYTHASYTHIHTQTQAHTHTHTPGDEHPGGQAQQR